MKMQSPKQVIENIRKIRFGVGIDTTNLPEDVRAHMEDSKKFKEDAARLVSDLHSRKPDFIFELIQNAEDNDYDKTTEPKVKFIVQENQLTLQNNERGFNEKNVRALCGIGETTKQSKKLGYIGEKGVGFKSVFMITNEPHIYSNGFQFEFRYDEKDPISIIKPHWIDDIPSIINLSETNIVLPLKDEVKSELNKLTKIEPSLLLFLRKLKLIEIEDRVQNKSETIARHDFEGKIEIAHSKGKDYWTIIKNSALKVPKHVREERRKDITETEMLFAFPLNSDGSADASKEQNIYAYLPIRPYGFKFIIQADFLLPPSREDIHKDDTGHSWNKWLRDNIASTFLLAVEEFKQNKNLKKTYYNYIPLAQEITDPFFSPVVEEIHKSLRETNCILAESENWQKPADVFLANGEIRKLISNKDLKSFFGKEYISPEMEAKREILTALGIQKFEVEHLLQCLQKTGWLETQSDGWFIGLYAYLGSQNLEEEQLKELCDLKIIRLENNELTSTSKESIFFPLDKGNNYGFEKEIPVLKRPLFEIKKKETRDEVRGFLKKLGVRNASPYEIIEEHILPIYESDDESSNWQSRGAEILLGYVRYIKDNLQKYEKESDEGLNANKESWKREDPLGRLKKSLYIRTDKVAEGDNYCNRPENIYLSKAYGNENGLETLFEGIEGVSFIHQEYIEDTIKRCEQARRKTKKGKIDLRKKREAEIKKWREFFVKVGVSAFLIVKKDSDTEVYEGPRYANNEVTKKPIMKQEKEETLWKDRSWEGTDWRGYYIQDDWVSNDFNKIIQKIEGLNDNRKIAICKKMLTLFDKHWKSYNGYVECYYYHRSAYQQGWCRGETESTFLITLKTTPWLPTSKGTLVRPLEVFLDKPEIKSLLGDKAPYLAVEIKNEDLINALGINSEANVEGALTYLKSLVNDGCQDKSIFTKLYEFINKHYEDNDDNDEVANSTFSENQIIYIPKTTQSYFVRKEVFWKDVSNVFGENRGYLEKHYPELKSFFVDRLGVSEKPAPKDYAAVLVDLSKEEKVTEEDEKVILKIYKELNRHLNPENNENLISEEDWWEGFVGGQIFWTEKERFWRNDDDVFVNDNEEIYKLFKDNPQMAFLKLPKNYHPKIRYFIEEACISYVSEAVKTKLATAEKPRVEQNLTEQIRKFAPYILRYLYHLENSVYEKLKKDGTLARLKNLQCHSVKNLQVEYVLNKQSVPAKRTAILHNGKLYIQNDSLGDTDHLAMELSKLLGESKGLDNFLISLFDKKTDDRIENLLKAKGVQELPTEEQEWFGIAEPVSIEEEVSRKIEEGAEERAETKTVAAPRSETAPVLGKTGSEFTPKKMSEGPAPEIVHKPPVVERAKWQPECRPEEVKISFEVFKPETKDSKTSTERRIATEESEPRFPGREDIVQDTLSSEDRKEIGRAGEKYVVDYLKSEMISKYPKGKIEEADDGFVVRLNGKVVVEVLWPGKTGDIAIGHDIKVIENGKEEYIEVKSTKTDGKEWFDISKKQWEFAQERGDRFHIYRIYNVGTKKETVKKLSDIPNPYQQWREGNIVAYPIRIRI